LEKPRKVFGHGDKVATKIRGICPVSGGSTVRPTADRGERMAGKKKYLGKDFGGEQRAIITKGELITLLGGASKYVDRMLHATRNGDPWLELVGNKLGKGGARVLIDCESVERALERLKRGEVPPLMPSERKLPVEKVKTRKGIPNKQGQTLIQSFDLLPKNAESVSFNLTLKSFVVHWQNGDTQWFGLKREKGRSTTLREISFLPKGDSMKLQPPEDPGYDESAADDMRDISL
jgi:hypothetical protein